MIKDIQRDSCLLMCKQTTNNDDFTPVLQLKNFSAKEKKRERIDDNFGRISVEFPRLFSRGKFNGARTTFRDTWRAVVRKATHIRFSAPPIYSRLNGKATSIHSTVKTLLDRPRICRRLHIVLYSADFVFPCDNALHS